MPVDLSTVGLVGQEAYDNHRLAQEQTRVQQMAALAKQQELEDAQRQQALEQGAASIFANVAKGDSTPNAQDGGDESISEKMRKAALYMFQGGADQRGLDFIKAANETAKQEQDITDSQVGNEKKRLESQLMTADLVYRQLGTARNQSEYEAAMDNLMNSPALSPEEKNHLRQLPDQFDPNVTKFLADQAISAKDAAQMQLKEQDQALRNKSINNTNVYRANRLAIDQAKLKEKQRQNDLKQRTGKSAAAPSKNELTSVETAVTNQIFDGRTPGKDDPDYVAFTSGSQAIASRAKAILASTQGIDWQTAVSRAILESQSSGDWQTGSSSSFFGLGPSEPDPSKTKFNDRGKTPDTALVAPLDEDGKVKTSAFQVGRYYITPKGRLKWTGKGWTP